MFDTTSLVYIVKHFSRLLRVYLDIDNQLFEEVSPQAPLGGLWMDPTLTTTGINNKGKLTFVGDLPGHLKKQQVIDGQVVLLPLGKNPAQ